MEHITTLSLSLEPADGFSHLQHRVYSLGPMLQSVLMEHTDAAYAEQLHASTFNPYSQYCFMQEDGNLVWHISALTDEAASRLLDPVSKIDSFTLRNLDKTISVVKKTRETVSVAFFLDLLKKDPSSSFRIRFATPTAFKSKGQYVIMPDVRLIFQNLLMRYNQAYAGDKEIDSETVDYIAEHVRVSSYSLRSCYFPRTMGKADKIPAFVGSLTLHAAGPQSLRGLVAMLLFFGEASGIGVKTSMGMGGVQLLQNASKSNPAEQGGQIGR